MFIQKSEMAGLKSYIPVNGDVIALVNRSGEYIKYFPYMKDKLKSVGKCTPRSHFYFEGTMSSFCLRQKTRGTYLGRRMLKRKATLKQSKQ